MTLTPLEAALIAGAIATFTAVMTRVISSRWHITRRECESIRASCQLHATVSAIAGIREDVRELCVFHRRHSRMLRVIMSKLEIPIEEQLKLEGDVSEEH
jgi:hypothetical protein